MSITRHADSHLDHNLTDAQIEYILGLSAAEGSVTVQTVLLPDGLGLVPCRLFGPIMGDDPIPESDVTYAKRGDRAGESRLVNRSPRLVRTVTVISGPHDGNPCVLFTAFGGPQAPREPFEDDSEESRTFWGQHALAAEIE